MTRADEIAMLEGRISAIETLREAAERAGDTASAIALAEDESDAEEELRNLKAEH